MGVMQENFLREQTEHSKTPQPLLNTYLLAGVGFGCFIGWDLIGVFSPATALLSYTDTADAFVLRSISIAALLATYIFCKVNADWVFQHRIGLATFCTGLSLLVIVNAYLSEFIVIPTALSVVAWFLFGVGSGVIDVIWCSYLSLIPTRRTMLTIAGASTLGTLLFVIAGGSSPASISLLAMLVILCALFALLTVLMRSFPKSSIPAVEDFNRAPTLSAAAAISVGSHGIIYGFITASMLIVSPQAGLAVGASGLIGALFAIFFAYREPKINLDNSFLQRISMPAIVVSLLLFPLLDGFGQILCSCIANVALAFTSILMRGQTFTENMEFQLQPIDRYAARQIPRWTGFFTGTVLAFLLSSSLPDHSVVLNFAIVGFAGLALVSFVIYNGNDSKTSELLDNLLTDQENTEASNPAVKLPSQFYGRCDAMISRYDLSPREGEIFYLLAKGRNAKHIQEKLCISPSTVKTHIYRIYRKMGINSQQLLIDIVDDGAPASKS